MFTNSFNYCGEKLSWKLVRMFTGQHAAKKGSLTSVPDAFGAGDTI